jgi:hypothetical protein
MSDFDVDARSLTRTGKATCEQLPCLDAARSTNGLRHGLHLEA